MSHRTHRTTGRNALTFATAPILLGLIGFVGLTGLSTTTAHAQRPAYTFVSIAEAQASGGLGSFNRIPSLSNTGRVAFTASDTTSNIAGVYTGTGVGSPIAVASATGSLTGIGGYADINADGSRVAFYGRTSSGTGIYTASATTAAGSPTPISTTTTGGTFGSFYDSFSPSLNGLGNVYYSDTQNATLVNAYNNVRTAPADGTGTVQTRFSPGNGVFAVGTNNISVSDNGTLAYRGKRSTVNASTPEGIYVQPLSGSAVAIALTGTTFDSYGELAVNNAGNVLYTGFGTGGIRLERYANGVTTSLLTTNGSVFDGFGAVSLNNNGSIGFLARLDGSYATGPTGSVEGIFVGTNPVTDAALLEGDALFGGTLRDVGFGRNGLNDLGQFAFWYQLTDGRGGIGIATRVTSAVGTPEPTTASLVGIALPLLSGMAVIRRRKK